MENYRIPPSAAWYTHAVCTPNNGLLYIAGNQSAIAYIPPVSAQPSDIPHNRIIHLNHHVKSIVCDPNWSSSKWFVTMNDQNTISVWNLETESICRGHRAHQQHRNSSGMDATAPSMSATNNNSNGGVMCITMDRHVLSIDRNAFVKYSIQSNTFALLNEHFIQKPNTVCVLKSSPYDRDILAVGYRNGLISIVNVKQSTVLQRLRAHDTEIVSLEWMRITPDDAQPIEIPIEPRPIKRAECRKPSTLRRDAPQPIVDDGDMFDIHSFDYLEDEFGTISKPLRSGDVADLSIDSDISVGTGKGIVNDNANFNYVEACESLRDQMVGEREDAEKESRPDDECSAVNMSDIQRAVTEGAIGDGSIVISESDNEVVSAEVDDVAKDSNRSTIGSSHDVNEFNDLENALNELEIADIKASGSIYLASGAQESFVVIWDVSDGSISDKLQLKVQHGKMAIPKPICAVAWYKPTELFVNSPNGKISKWSILSDVECKIHKSIELKEEFIEKSIIGICSNGNYETNEKYVWTFSMHLQIIGRKLIGESSEIIANLCTLPIGMLSICECPHDPNRIAIAGNNKRISILDLTTFKANNIQMQALTSKIQGKVLALAWHPQHEGQIAFSTNEGRVGVFDIGKPSSQPEIMRNFCGKNVYSVSYGKSIDDQSILFACNDRRLMLFAGQSTKNTTDHSFKVFTQGVSVVSVNEIYVAVGLANGSVKIFDRQLHEVSTKQLSKKYISSLAWSSVRPSQLAVASMDDKCHIIEMDSDTIDTLVGHQSGVACVKWSNQSATKLVSAGFDGSVRVWDTMTKECIAWYRYENRMFCAIFMPTDENYVICSGQSETVHIFDVRQHMVADVGEFKAKTKKKSTLADVNWATLHQTDVPKMKLQEKKKLRKLEKGLEQSTTAVAEDGMKTITNALESVSLETSYKLNFTTIFHLTNKELNKEPLKCLEHVLTGDASDVLHTKLFSSREDVQQLLKIELQNHNISKTESIGNLIIPQIYYKLKENIVDSITAKKLTQQQIALAPSISYEFWRKCCIAYASQCFEEGLVLQGLPYLLAIHQTTELIERLCEAHFYREAWVVAKMYREAEEKAVFESIATKWIMHLEQMGSLDSAAMIAYMAEQPVVALNILNKRKNQTPQIESIVKLLQERITTNIF